MTHPAAVPSAFLWQQEENLRMGAFIEWAPMDFAARRDHVWALFPRLAERRRQRAATMSGGEQAISRWDGRS